MRQWKQNDKNATQNDNQKCTHQMQNSNKKYTREV